MTFLLKRKIFQILFVLILLTACKEEKPIISVRSIHEVQTKVDEILKTQQAEEGKKEAKEGGGQGEGEGDLDTGMPDGEEEGEGEEESR